MKKYHVFESWDDPDVFDKKTWFIVVNHPSCWLLPNNLAFQQLDAPITSSLVLNCRMLHNYVLSRRLTDPTVARRKEKDVNWANSVIGECSWHHQRTTLAGKIRYFFWTGNGNTRVQTLQATPKIIVCFLSQRGQLKDANLAAVLLLWLTESQFWHCKNTRKNWNHQRTTNFLDNLGILR